jgi:hypothetical protein
MDLEQEISCAEVIIERNFYGPCRLRTLNNETSNCWKICVVCGDQVIIRTRAPRRRARTTTVTWLGQLSIKVWLIHRQIHQEFAAH